MKSNNKNIYMYKKKKKKKNECLIKMLIASQRNDDQIISNLNASFKKLTRFGSA